MYDKLFAELLNKGGVREIIKRTMEELKMVINKQNTSNYYILWLYFLINKIVQIVNTEIKIIEQSKIEQSKIEQLEHIKTDSNLEKLIQAAKNWLKKWNNNFQEIPPEIENNYKTISTNSQNSVTNLHTNFKQILQKLKNSNNLNNLNNLNNFDGLKKIAEKFFEEKHSLKEKANNSLESLLKSLENKNFHKFNLQTAIILLKIFESIKNNKSSGGKHILPLDDNLLNEAKEVEREIGYKLNTSDKPINIGGKITKKINKNKLQNKNSLHNIIMNHTLKKRYI